MICFSLDRRALSLAGSIMILAAVQGVGCVGDDYAEPAPAVTCNDTALVTYAVGRSTVCLGENLSFGAESRAPACAAHRDATTSAVFATSDVNVVVCEKSGGPSAPFVYPAICRTTGLGVATVHALSGTLRDDLGVRVTVERCDGEAGATSDSAASD